MRAAVFLVVGLAVVVPAGEAWPCGGMECQDAALVGDGTVPSNVAALVWTPRRRFAADPGVVLTASVALVASDGERVPVRFLSPLGYGWAIAPETPLREGIAYELDNPNFCGSESLPSLGLVTVGPSAPLPAALGTLAVGTATVSPIELAAGAPCVSRTRSAHAAIQLQLAADALPWRDVLVFETWVDGQPWRPQRYANRVIGTGESWEGRGRDLVYGACPSMFFVDQPGLALHQDHTVVMRASLPGTAVVLETPPVTVRLSCGEPARDAGVADVGATEPDATAGDLDATAPDAPSSEPPARPDASAPDAGAAPDALATATPGEGDGCTCVAAADRGWATGLLLGVALLLLRRRAA